MPGFDETDLSARSDRPRASTKAYEAGQRLVCEVCQSEIEVISPCTCDPPDQSFICCGKPMMAAVGTSVHLNVES